MSKQDSQVSQTETSRSRVGIRRPELKKQLSVHLPQLIACWESNLDFLDEFKRQKASAYVCAGAVRDVLACRYFGWQSARPRDLDIGVALSSRSKFDGVMLECGGRRNRYGGYRLGTGIYTCDVWRMEDTVGLQVAKRRFSIENVLRSFVLNCNAIAFGLFDNEFIDLGASDSLQKAELNILDGAILHNESVFAAKAVVLSRRFPFRVTPQLEGFIRKHINNDAYAHEIQKWEIASELSGNS